ncbi:MAG: OmpA family protein, partial [Pseudomonadota bacterium]
LLPLGLLIAFTYLSTRDAIQADVTARAQAALQQSGFDWALTNFDGRDGTLGGQAFDSEEQLRANALVRDVWGVRVSDDRSALIEEASQFVWSADRSDDTIRLTGFFPNSKSRDAVLSEARKLFPTSAVIDDMKPARGAPPEGIWLGGVRFGLNQLVHLEPGASVNLRDQEFEIDGRARTVDDYQSVTGQLAQAMPDGVTLLASRVSPPRVSPFTTNFIYDGRSVTLSGHAPSDSGRAAINEAVKATLPSASIVDRLSIASGAPTDWRTASLALMTAIAPLSTAKVEMSDRKIAVTGLAEKEQTALDVGKRLDTDLPSGFTTEHDIKFVRPAVPVVQPFTTSIAVDDATVVVRGYVPSQTRRQSIMEFAAQKFPRRRIVDELQIATGQPQEWGTCLDRGLGALGEIGQGTLAISDKVITLQGQTEDRALHDALPGRLKAATSRTCTANVNLELLRQPEPDLTWTATRQGNVIGLSGEVPDSSTRARLVDRAQALFPGAQIDDQMRIVPGDGTRWQTVAGTGLELLALLRSGRASLDGQSLLIEGEAPDAASAAAIRQRLKTALADGYRGDGRISVRSDAMIWAEEEAKRREREAALKKQEAERQARLDRAREQERREAAERQRAEAERRAREADARRAEAEAREAERRRAEAERRRADAERLRREEEARAQAARRAEAERQRQAAIAAAAAAAEARRKAEEAARQQAEDERRIRLALDQARCEAALEEVRSGAKINFATAQADIVRRSYGLLDRLATTLRNCENVTVEIEGHTDSQGTDENNMRLSQRRAEAVVDYLVKAGVDRAQLTARGFGETRPAVPNTSRENMARNRRIEFIVRADD